MRIDQSLLLNYFRSVSIALLVAEKGKAAFTYCEDPPKSIPRKTSGPRWPNLSLASFISLMVSDPQGQKHPRGHSPSDVQDELDPRADGYHGVGAKSLISKRVDERRGVRRHSRPKG